MSKGKTLLLPIIIVSILCVIAAIAGFICMGPAKSTQTPSSQEKTFFDYSEKEQLVEAGLHLSPGGSYEIRNASAYGYEGTALITVNDNKVSSVSFQTVLSSDELLTSDIAKDRVNALVDAYSKKHGFASDADPVLVQFTADELYKSCPADKYDALIQGYVMFERSYRDAEGVLWILHVYSPMDNVLVGCINKYPDDSGYADYVPQEIIQKEVNE